MRRSSNPAVALIASFVTAYACGGSVNRADDGTAGVGGAAGAVAGTGDGLSAGASGSSFVSAPDGGGSHGAAVETTGEAGVAGTSRGGAAGFGRGTAGAAGQSGHEDGSTEDPAPHSGGSQQSSGGSGGSDPGSPESGGSIQGGAGSSAGGAAVYGGSAGSAGATPVYGGFGADAGGEGGRVAGSSGRAGCAQAGARPGGGSAGMGESGASGGPSEPVTQDECEAAGKHWCAADATCWSDQDATWGAQQKLTASNAALKRLFGTSVSVKGDTAVVGAFGGAETDAAYVFTRTGTTWSPEQRLIAADDDDDSHVFGVAVALSGDTAVIGAPGDDAGADGAGSVYVFVRVGTVWSLQQKLVATNPAVWADMGSSVAVSGDTVIAGAEAENHGGLTQGAAYVFVRNGTSWTQQQKLLGSVSGQGAFGQSVSLSGDTAVIGTKGASEPGLVYVFVRNGTSWTEQQRLAASDADLSDDFGWSVSVSGDTAVVGAPYHHIDGVWYGAAYVFVRNGSTWTEQQKLVSSELAPGDAFGYSVAVAGETVVIGAPDRQTGRGAVYVFTRSGGVWSERSELMASDAASSDLLGTSVAVDGLTLLGGATHDDNLAEDAGCAWVFALQSPCSH
jgi:hypothetical protein